MNCVKKKKEVNYMNKTEQWNYLGKVEDKEILNNAIISISYTKC